MDVHGFRSDILGSEVEYWIADTYRKKMCIPTLWCKVHNLMWFWWVRVIIVHVNHTVSGRVTIWGDVCLKQQYPFKSLAKLIVFPFYNYFVSFMVLLTCPTQILIISHSNTYNWTNKNLIIYELQSKMITCVDTFFC